ATGTASWNYGFPLANFPADGSYTVHLRVTDNVGNVNTSTSTSFTIDTTAPTAGTVNDGLGADIDFQTSTSALSANWSGFSDSNGIATYQWAIGTTPGGTQTQAFTNVTQTSATANLSLSNGTTYYVSVRAIDSAGNVGAAATSNGVKVDTT